MSALAQFHVWSGGRASGSDRAFDRGESAEIRGHLERAGVLILPQDGEWVSGVAEALDTAVGPYPSSVEMVVSTAVEETVPDVRAARAHRIPILHRSELLARFVQAHRTIAVTGTSGKSTVTAMIFEILRGAGRDPSVITGGDLRVLQEQGFLGNAWVGRGDWLVIEADESDGSLVRYAPWLGVLLNLQRDHQEPEAFVPIFDTFRTATSGPFVLGEDPALDRWAGGAIRFGFSERCETRVTEVATGPSRSTFAVDGTPFELSVPGRHNVQNAAAAIAACRACGLKLREMREPLRRFLGVARRFQVIGRSRGCEVIDDFAHNPEKIRASIATARLRARRILAVYQPHGFGPTRFLRDGLIAAFSESLTPDDRLYMPEIFYAGGTAVRDISSREIVEEVAARGVPSVFREERPALIDLIAGEARPGDVVLVMGARDPSLTRFCREVLARLGAAG
jgi:UDP-N-acetylmuramate--alanine ligase